MSIADLVEGTLKELGRVETARLSRQIVGDNIQAELRRMLRDRPRGCRLFATYWAFQSLVDLMNANLGWHTQDCPKSSMADSWMFFQRKPIRVPATQTELVEMLRRWRRFCCLLITSGDDQNLAIVARDNGVPVVVMKLSVEG